VTGALLNLAVFAAIIVLLAEAARVVPGVSRRRLRRSVILFGINVLVVLVTRALGALGVAEVSQGFSIAGDLLRILLIINLSALALFDLLLALVRWDFPDILNDLTVGAAYLVAAGWLMHHVGVNVTSIIATSAVVTAVIGLSLQATLGNIVGGIAIQVDDSLEEGDWI